MDLDAYRQENIAMSQSNDNDNKTEPEPKSSALRKVLIQVQ